jgi:tetratricopeptide (TPR) repeat protein
MRSAISIIVSLFFILLVVSTSLAQRIVTTMRGTVRITANAVPFAAVRVQLQMSGITIQETFLRENRFEFLNVEGGQYTLIVDAPGYETVQRAVVVPGDWPEIDLRPQRNSVRPAEGVSVWNLRVPESARRQFDAAQNNLLEHNCVRALDHLKKAIHIYAEYGDAHKVMGECYAQMNQFETAEQELKLALEQPHAPELHLLLRKVYIREGEQGLAARQLELYVEEKPVRAERGRQ